MYCNIQYKCYYNYIDNANGVNEMTNYQAKQVLAGIADCDRIIAKEGSRAADLRPAYMQQVLDHAIAHKAKLQAMLAKNAPVPSVWIS
jgi:hypothetical protein